MPKRPTSNSPMQNNPNGDTQSMEKLKQSAGYIFAAIIVALIGYFGWTYFQGSGNKVDTEAADKFSLIETENDALQNAQSDSDDGKDARQKLYQDIDTLVAEHGSTIYAWQALMIKASNAINQNDHEVALDALKKALEIDLNDAGLHSIAQLRYATVLLASGNTDEAMAEAKKEVPEAFEASQQELIGDIYLTLKDKDSAIRSYENAWSMLSKRNEDRPLLQLKLESLGVNPEPIEQPDPIVNVDPMALPEEISSDSTADSMPETATDATPETATE